MFKLVQLSPRKWAIYDTVSRVYYYGTKKSLVKRLAELNKS
jgi:hypothetical protein